MQTRTTDFLCFDITVTDWVKKKKNTSPPHPPFSHHKIFFQTESTSPTDNYYRLRLDAPLTTPICSWIWSKAAKLFQTEFKLLTTTRASAESSVNQLDLSAKPSRLRIYSDKHRGFIYRVHTDFGRQVQGLLKDAQEPVFVKGPNEIDNNHHKNCCYKNKMQLGWSSRRRRRRVKTGTASFSKSWVSESAG